MPKPKNPKLSIRLDLLKPQSNPEKIASKLIHWLLSSGRYIFILVEGVVLIAFIARFKLDADLATTKESIDKQLPYIEALSDYEVSIRKTQLKLSTINSFSKAGTNYASILKEIASQTPAGVKIANLNLRKSAAKINIQMNALAQSNNDLGTFIGGLKQDQAFSDVSVTNIGFDKGSLTFSVSASADLSQLASKSL